LALLAWLDVIFFAEGNLHAAYYAERKRKQVLAFVWVNPTHFAIFTTHTRKKSLVFVVRAGSQDDELLGQREAGGVASSG
jgi:hypothetical protein